MAADPAQNWLTAKGLAEFGGATLGVMIVTNAIRAMILKSKPAWAVAIGFLFSVVLTVSFHPESHDYRGYLIQFLNAILVFNAAAGTNQLGAAASDLGKKQDESGGAGARAADARRVPRFFTDWWG
jgi:hypothetical protein